MMRTRIKICGLTREDDVRMVIDAGADALGFVFYPESSRFVTVGKAAMLSSVVPAFVSTVGLFVNAKTSSVVEVVRDVRLSFLQFHGDETPEQCHEAAVAVNLPFIRAFRVRPDTMIGDLLQYEKSYCDASPFFKGLLLDTWTDAYGGAGKVFDWSLISKEIGPRVVLSGGLSAQNVTDAIAQLKPYAVDISSGVEVARGIKDAEKVHAFISAVRKADGLD